MSRASFRFVSPFVFIFCTGSSNANIIDLLTTFYKVVSDRKLLDILFKINQGTVAKTV